ncbi:MAG: hypothetical protein KGH63_04710, partial [Candidatus Micrarchaeota archaeon]|nr:hypothetical protein [Candidatus Micrarchaeota archaeon]
LICSQVFWVWSVWSPLQAPLYQMAHLSDQMPAGARVLPIGSGLAVPNGEMGNFPYFQAWGYWVVQKNVFSPYLFSATYTPIVYDANTTPARNQVMVWLNNLVGSEFSHPASDCSAWQAYYHQINWSLIAQQYGYVALRKGSCDNQTYMPASFRLAYSDPPLFLYKTNRSS